MGLIIKRKRWMQGSSSEESEDANGAISIEAFVAEKDPFRIAPGTKIPVPYPFDTDRVSRKGREIFEKVEPRCLEILQRHGIHKIKTRYLSTWRRGFTSLAKDTLIFMTENDADPIRWKEAITKVNDIVTEEASEHSIRLELRNPKFMYQDVSYSIPDGLIYSTLGRIMLALEKEARLYIPSGMIKVIGCRMRGSPLDPATARPTAMVLVTAESYYQWGVVENDISRALGSINTNGVEISVEISPGILVPAAMVSDIAPSWPRPVRNLSKIAKNGISIGPQGTSSAGSLGVWVWYHPEHGQKKPAFLTCYHVVAEGEKNAIRRANNDKYGIGLSGEPTRHPITIDYPAPFDRDITKREIQTLLDRGTDVKESFETLQTYAERGIGQVEYASGNVISQSNRRMDWAIVVLNDQAMMGKNQVPLRTFSPEEMFFARLVEPDWTKDQTVTKITAPKEGDWVAKDGRTTDIQAGEIARLDDVIEHKALNALTREVQIQAAVGGEHFAKHGDSGSMVVNYQGEWIGIIMAVELSSGSSYMMSSVGILEDIKQRTGGGTISLS